MHSQPYKQAAMEGKALKHDAMTGIRDMSTLCVSNFSLNEAADCVFDN